MSLNFIIQLLYKVWIYNYFDLFMVKIHTAQKKRKTKCGDNEININA